MADLRSLYKLFEPALRPVGNAASFSNESWSVEVLAGRTLVSARVRLTNEAGDREVMVYDVRPELFLLSTQPVDALQVQTDLRSTEPDVPPRPDRYWTAFVIKPHGHTELDIDITVEGQAHRGIYALCLLLHVELYGAEGLGQRIHHLILPIPDPAAPADPVWRPVGDGLAVAALRTHLLTPVDDPVAVALRYAVPHAQPGDVLVIGESPLAIMQNRFRHPAEIAISPLTRRLCYFLSGRGSLGTAPGLQALIDLVGTPRVVWALTKGLLAKLANRDGDFYRTAGEQSRLIDDVTGTLAPYDRFIVLGPADAAGVTQAVHAATGLEVAVVDANDLGKVDVLASTPGVDRADLVAALRSNPAGNAAENTPLVLVRGNRRGVLR